MISIQHASCLPSILACAAATTLPPSPLESPSRCDTPPIHPADIRLPESPVIPSSPTENKGPEKDSVDGTQPCPSSCSTKDADVSRLPPATAPYKPVIDKPALPLETAEELRDGSGGKKTTTPRVDQVTFVQFARRFHLEKHQGVRKANLLHRLRTLRVSLGISTRLLRVGSTIQKGLVESFKQGDKSSFVSLYNSIFDMREACEAASRRNIHGHDPLICSSSDLERDLCSHFVQRLTQRSKEDLLEILTLVRTDSQFLFRCIAQLTPSQLSALVSPVHTLDLHDSGSSRSRAQPLFSKRTAPHSTAFKDHVFALERTDSLSALVLNAFADPLDSNRPEAALRLKVWSSTCAKLVAYGGSGHYSFVGHLLSFWAGAREWKAKAKFELYLMDTLQSGAYLLEQPDLRSPGSDAQYTDPLRTDVAEKFFQSSVCTLFGILDDQYGGLPTGALEFGNAVLSHLNVVESRNRFLEYIFLHWFFGKFLHTAIIYPESLGLLLDFHISKDARERLLRQISFRAQAQVSHVLRSMPQYSLAHPNIKIHVENMLYNLLNPMPGPEQNPAAYTSNGNHDSVPIANPLLLSIADITTILDVLFPRPVSAFPPHQPHYHQPLLSPTSALFRQAEPGNRNFQPNLFQGRLDTPLFSPASSKTTCTTEMTFHDATGCYTSSSSYSASPVYPQDSIQRKADRIRFEFSEINEADDRPTMDHPANEDWAMIFVSPDGMSLSYDPIDDGSGRPGEYDSFRDGQFSDRSDPLRDAILKLVEDFEVESDDTYSLFEHSDFSSPNKDDAPCLIQRFTRATEICRREYDFVGAHYWWNALKLLKSTSKTLSLNESVLNIIRPMLDGINVSMDKQASIIRYCERNFLELKRMIERLQTMLGEMMSVFQGLRNKMWFMTDVKNSLRYEDARNVALALKKMGVPQGLYSAPDPKPKHGQRTLGGSFLQKPEVQVMNIMKAPESQGGPSKLADEQVEVTRKWLENSGIDNFCKGEERIHRFCYEVKMSVNKLVGDTMYDTPVLWSSELYQKERSLYETSGARSVTGLSMGTNVRPTSIASEDSFYSSQLGGQRGYDYMRPMSDVHSLGRKSSYQSLASDRWRPGRDGGGDTSSIGDSPGRTISSSTADLYQPFWSPTHTQTQSMTSASSLQSRPPSTFGEISLPKRSDRKTQAKTAFLEELKRTVTSLLLSDLGSPVWSCGSETDDWFSLYLNNDRIKQQTRKRTMTQRFLTELNGRCEGPSPSRPRRSRSVDTIHHFGMRDSSPASTSGNAVPVENIDVPDFEYSAAFRQLIDKFSHPSNPFVKLKALQDIHTLVIASLTAKSTQCQPDISVEDSGRYQRNSVSGGSPLQTSRENTDFGPETPISESMSMTTESLPNPGPTEDQIIAALRDLIQTLQPKTLFRDLQFIAAFVPSETLNRTDSGTAFLHFGLAAFGLKDDICNSIVEITDSIVSQELVRPRRRSTIVGPTPSLGTGLREAARWWIIPAKEGHPVAQRELAILYLTHPELVRCVTLPLTLPRDTFKTDMMYRRGRDSKSDPQSMCLALHWMQLAAAGGDKLAQNRLREREEFESIS